MLLQIILNIVYNNLKFEESKPSCMYVCVMV